MFSKCTSLSGITISEGVTNIRPEAFRDCSSLTSVTLPTNVTSIGASAFDCCNARWHVLYKGNEQSWNAIEISGTNNLPLLTSTRHYNCTGNEICDPVNKKCSVCTIDEPQPTDPSSTDTPTGPDTTAPSNIGKDSPSTIWIVVTITTVLLGGGAAAGWFFWKKKH